MQTTEFRRFALRPKPESQDLPLPVLPQHNWSTLSYMLRDLCPAERRTLREIAEFGDLVIVRGRPWLVAPLTDDALDTIAAFEPESEDLEQDEEDDDAKDGEPDDPAEDDSDREREKVDDEPDYDDEPGDYHGTLPFKETANVT